MTRPRIERATGVAAAAAGLVLAVLGLIAAPTDAVQGQAQRLMYVHVPAAWVAYIAFTAVLVASVAYLVRRDLRWDHRAQAAAELGAGLTALAIVLGMLWGRPVWGVWWQWEPRLVTTLILLLVYLGYLGIRGLTEDPHTNARRAAVVGVAGFVNVPIVHFSVVWWRTLHQPPTVLRPGGPAAIDATMLAALLSGVVAFSLAGAWVYLRRTRALAERAPSGPIAQEPVDGAEVPRITVSRGARP